MEKSTAEGKGVIVIVGKTHSRKDELTQFQYFPDIPPIQRMPNEAGALFRVVGTGSQILRDIGGGKMRLLSSPIRYSAISGFHLQVIEFIENE